MLKCNLSKLDSLFAEISKTHSLYLPVDGTDKKARYQKWESGVSMSLALSTVRSAKDFFFPQTENLVDFKMDGKKIEILEEKNETEDFVLFGVRACDARSFAILDRVFLSDPVDTFYKSRREHGIVITMACTRPAETCFCHTFGIDPADPEGDITCWKTKDTLYLRENTEKGKKLLSSLSSLLTECDSKDVSEQQKKTREIVAKLPLANLTTNSFGEDKMNTLFGDPRWKTLSEACLGCGTCTFVCPTCQCFDIKDFDTGHGIQRFRCWDSCMYSEFTKMSAGQPRQTQVERFRQRFMHKLVYFPADNEGVFGCVGCGRCLKSCPVSMNIVKVMKALGGNENE